MDKWEMNGEQREALDVILSVGEFETLVQHIEFLVNQAIGDRLGSFGD